MTGLPQLPIETETFAQVARRQCGIQGDQVLVAAISGGADSLSMLDLLYKVGLKIIVVHYDHHLREQAAADAEFVRREAQKRSLPFILGEGDVADLAKANRLSIEEAARVARYTFLFATARQVNAQAIAVGHTADDQVETVLMHILRGTGMSGLRGMSFRSILPTFDARIPIVRPLLAYWRTQIEEYCRRQGFDPRFDQTNAQLTYYRNRIRLALIPSLQSYNPQVKNLVWKMSQSISQDYELLEELAERTWEVCFESEGKGYVCLSYPRFKSLHTGLKRLLLRKGIARLFPFLRDIDYEVSERALVFLENPPVDKRIDLARGLILWKEGNSILIGDGVSHPNSASYPQFEPARIEALELPFQMILPDGWVLEGKQIAIKSLDDLVFEARNPQVPEDYRELLKLPWDAWIDSSRVNLPLQLRCRRSGDWFIPYGMSGKRVKLAEFFINQKLPGAFRDNFPLVCSREQVIWVPGFRLAQDVSVSLATRQVIHLRFHRQ